ncbi:hypothetical protein P152DRAFT_462837 [Eremomyces bilateralis CBS 781.70]|uniref:Uncharacterized protein n=1 Tax=Eremomyces bilateralis CBS 781.70 TaxID=1392243 RepID=A0A6G1FQY6_9PEZI|nr:uncharacterized protein P152DRAFT_462837 [Eremomyces bilateralis CBS 781.70]KAF1808183.1 hypothetical protein P152DRAFT_462837 [Eremomyces bilateralis CBS 781.70]
MESLATKYRSASYCRNRVPTPVIPIRASVNEQGTSMRSTAVQTTDSGFVNPHTSCLSGEHAEISCLNRISLCSDRFDVSKINTTEWTIVARDVLKWLG